jgi:hypothetical protein
MKRILLTLLIFLCALLCGKGTLNAQGLSGLKLNGVDAALIPFFGEFKAFSADATVRVYDREEQEILSTPMKFAISDDRIRMDIEMSKLKSKDLPGGAGASLKQLGMDTVATLILPDQGAAYVIYPGMESILRVPIKAEELKSPGKDFKIEREEMGRETLDGHPCIRYRVTVSGSSGLKQKALTWNAEDLKGFPVQIQILDGDQLVIMRFRNLNLAVPFSGLFTLPGGYAQYDSQQALMQAVMIRAFSGLQEE